MRYIILCFAFITILFTANTLMDKYFAKEKERRILFEELKYVPEYLWCERCQYADNVVHFKDAKCPRCGLKIGG